MFDELCELIQGEDGIYGGYEIVDGHHKWLAAKLLGVKYVPIKIINT